MENPQKTASSGLGRPKGRVACLPPSSASRKSLPWERRSPKLEEEEEDTACSSQAEKPGIF